MSASKSFSNETSERYARALFEVAKDSSEIEQIEKSLQDFLFFISFIKTFLIFILYLSSEIENKSFSRGNVERLKFDKLILNNSKFFKIMCIE